MKNAEIIKSARKITHDELVLQRSEGEIFFTSSEVNFHKFSTDDKRELRAERSDRWPLK